MMIEEGNQLKRSIFSPVTSVDRNQIFEKRVVMSSILSLTEKDDEQVLVLAFKDRIIVQNTHRKPSKIGFRLISAADGSGQSFFCSNEIVLGKWLEFLQSSLNQTGFHDQFKPIKKLGKGNFATVYEIQRIEDGKHFAVKAFSKANLKSTKLGLQGLQNELNIMRNYRQQNLIQIEGVYESDNSIYVILELLEGGNLLERFQLVHFQQSQNNKKMNAGEIIEFLIGLMKGLAHLQSLRIAHRDLKLENILFRSMNSFDPVIVDFGLSTFVDEPEYLFYRCGTPGYVAPEILKLPSNQRIEPSCDIFSAGVIFHILLTGKSLFQGNTFEQVFAQNKKCSFDLNSQAYSHYNYLALDLMGKMLELDSSKRIKADECLAHNYLCEPSKLDSPITTAQSLEMEIRITLDFQQQLKL